MLATALIYFSGLGLCLLAGVAVSSILSPQRWFTMATAALGGAAVVVVAYWVGFFLPGRGEVLLLALGSAAGLLFLTPLFSIGPRRGPMRRVALTRRGRRIPQPLALPARSTTVVTIRPGATADRLAPLVGLTGVGIER